LSEAKHPAICLSSSAAATKFIGGHSDVTAGILAVRDPALAERVYFVQNAEGTALGPFDSWLLVRGLKTMSLRMERQTANAQRIAEWLAAHPMVRSVNYPGLAGHPGRAVHEAQASSAGSVLSFITNDAVVSKAVCEETELFKITVSFGNVCSLIRSVGVCKWVCGCARLLSVQGLRWLHGSG
jgi:cystathionine beta-lyase